MYNLNASFSPKAQEGGQSANNARKDGYRDQQERPQTAGKYDTKPNARIVIESSSNRISGYSSHDPRSEGVQNTNYHVNPRGGNPRESYPMPKEQPRSYPPPKEHVKGAKRPEQGELF